MSVPDPIPAGWFRALTLGERLAWRLPAGLPPSTPRGSAASRTGARTGVRERQRRHAAARRRGPDRGSARGPPRRAGRRAPEPDRFPPVADRPRDVDRSPFPLPPSVGRRAEHGFLEVAAAFLGRAWDGLVAGVVGCDGIGVPAEVAALLFEEPVHTVLNLLCRPLVLELHVAKLAGTLVGGDPRSAVPVVRRPVPERDAVRALLEEYPVLARAIAVTLDRAVEARVEFVRRLVDIRPHSGRRSASRPTGTGWWR